MNMNILHELNLKYNLIIQGSGKTFGTNENNYKHTFINISINNAFMNDILTNSYQTFRR